MLIGYLRDCPGDSAHAAAQRRSLAEAECEQVVEERPGAQHGGDQPKLHGLLARLQPGDVVVVPQLDSLGCHLADVVQWVQQLTAAGIGLRSLAEALSTPASLDPVQLLNAIRTGQQRLVEIADRPVSGELMAPTAPTLEAFLSGLRTAWREGEVRPTSRPKEKAKRGRRRPDPLVAVTAQLQDWFEAELWRTARELLERLQVEQPGTYPVGLVRTLQRRLKVWRRDKAHELVFGATPAGDEPAPAALDSVT